MTRSIFLLSACNSCRQWEVDRCTAQTKQGNTSQDSAKTAVPITLSMPMIPRSAIILMNASIDVLSTDVLLAPRLSGLHRPRTTLHTLQGFTKKVSIYENDTTRNSHMQVCSFRILTNEIVPLTRSPQGRGFGMPPDRLPAHTSPVRPFH